MILSCSAHILSRPNKYFLREFSCDYTNETITDSWLCKDFGAVWGEPFLTRNSADFMVTSHPALGSSTGLAKPSSGEHESSTQQLGVF